MTKSYGDFRIVKKMWSKVKKNSWDPTGSSIVLIFQNVKYILPCLKQMFKILYKTCVVGHHFSIVIAGVFSRVQINISRFSKFPKFIKKLFITTFKFIKLMKLQGVQDITSNSCNNLGKPIPTTSSLDSLLLQKSATYPAKLCGGEQIYHGLTKNPN